MTKKCLILSAGGSYGAYECGVVKALIADGHRYDEYYGSSSGALNCAFLSMYPKSEARQAIFDLENLWLDLADKWSEPDLSFCTLFCSYLCGRSAMNSSKNLKSLLKNLHFTKVGTTKLFVATTEMKLGALFIYLLCLSSAIYCD